MRAVTYQGIKDIQVKNVEDPVLKKKDDKYVAQICISIRGQFQQIKIM